MTSRPWQGTLLALIEGIGAAICFFTVMILFLLKGSGESLFSSAVTNVQAEAAIFLIGLDIFLSGTIILLTLATLYTLRGRRWPIIFCITFFGLRILLLLIGLALKWQQNWYEVAVTIIALYCSIVCIRHPFYNLRNGLGPLPTRRSL